MLYDQMCKMITARCFFSLFCSCLQTATYKICAQLKAWRTMTHNCHGKLEFTKANSNSPRQIQIRHGLKFTFTAANSNSPRQIQIHHGKFKFTMANSNSPRQIQIHHGTPRQIQIHHCSFCYRSCAFWLVLVVCASFCGGLPGPTGFWRWLIWGFYRFLWAWVILGFRGCRVWAGSGHWSGVMTVYVMHSGAHLCLALVGFYLWPWLRLVGR